MRAISIYDVMDLVVREQRWTIGPSPGEEVLRYTDFYRIVLINEITTSERKTKELWKMIGDLGLGRKINQTKTYIVDIPQLGMFLARKFTSYSAMMSPAPRRDGAAAEEVRA